MVTLQRDVDFGHQKTNAWKTSFTINAAGDKTEGVITTVDTTEENVLEIFCQNYKNVFIEGRNEDDTNVAEFKTYATRKWQETIPDTGDAFWTVTGVHWELIDTQTGVTTNTNTTPQTLVDIGYTYIVVTVESAVAGTESIVRAVITN